MFSIASTFHLKISLTRYGVANHHICNISGPFNRVFFQISIVAARQQRFKGSLVGCGRLLHMEVTVELSGVELTGMDLKHKDYSEEVIHKDLKLKLLSI